MLSELDKKRIKQGLWAGAQALILAGCVLFLLGGGA